MKRVLAFVVAAALTLGGLASPALSAPYAEIVIDARNGEVLRSRSADRVLHPASLTKMMTLYVAFDAITKGEIGLDDTVRVSRNAASEPPSRLGLRSGQRISLRYLLRAAALKSGNDAATAIGEAISGSEAAFARRMTETARAMGMTSTTFRNAHGLTQRGHMSTARDMATLSRHLIYDFPQYYNLFGATSRYAGVRTVRNTNRRLLNSYRGADGIKTGFTNAAGYNLAASAERGNERVIAVIFGGRSSDARYRRMVELLDLGFERAPSRVALVRPQMQETGAIAASFRPMPRGGVEPVTQIASAANLVGSAFVSTANASQEPVSTGSSVAPIASSRPAPRRINGGWAVQLGAYREQRTAERVLREVAMTMLPPLSDGLQEVTPAELRGMSLYEARYVGLSEMQAVTACAALQSQDRICRLVAPEN
ncbi:D-alanyl-D-alanine carboxypeptidase [Rubricella aquisinus]|uniref:D-alanyl-D-alanine carboxypeptidase n=1 Tax=Rubricella aquisinus TaxID=2028108 RepID=A0A840WQX0_9RHOB|nr:D-alanyl-D-alanine carboxypeptidase family protein [Rubricella aquisinus]MBB5517131.1 D-alanyl-D-alanine carboxypeptidase [Rubricella aquisinus]